MSSWLGGGGEGSLRIWRGVGSGLEGWVEREAFSFFLYTFSFFTFLFESMVTTKIPFLFSEKKKHIRSKAEGGRIGSKRVGMRERTED